MPSKKPQINVRVEPETQAALEEMATALGVSLSQVVLSFIHEGLDRCSTLGVSDSKGVAPKCVSAIRPGTVLKGTDAATMLQGATIEQPGYMGDKLLAPLALAGGWLWVTSKTANGNQTHLKALLEVPIVMMDRWRAMEDWKQERLTQFREEVERYLADQSAAHEEPMEERPSSDLLDCPEENLPSVEPLPETISSETIKLKRDAFCKRYGLDPGSNYSPVVPMANAGGWVAPDGLVWTVEGRGTKAIWTAAKVPAIAAV